MLLPWNVRSYEGVLAQDITACVKVRHAICRCEQLQLADHDVGVGGYGRKRFAHS